MRTPNSAEDMWMNKSKYEPPGWLSAWIDHIPRGAALDLGAGQGGLAAWLSERGFNVTAVERDPMMLSVLHNRIGGDRIKVVEADLAEFQPKPEHSSLIIASSVLHFIHPRALASVGQRLLAGLAPGGLLMAEVFTVDDPSCSERKAHLDQIAPNTFALSERSGLIHYFDQGQLRSLFADLHILLYQEGRRLDSSSDFGYRAGATLIARRINH